MKKLKNFWRKCKYKKALLMIVIFLLLLILWFWVDKYLEKREEARLEKARQEEILRLENIKKEKEARKNREAEAKKRYIENLDLQTDSSLTKFVSARVPFIDKSYVPENLESISWDYVYDAKWGSQVLRKEANYALQKMSVDFYRSFEQKIKVVSAYRSYAYQQWIKNRWCPDNLCAKAWYSEHQSGLAFDLWETTTNSQFLSKPDLKKYFEWLNNNAHKYGFTNTYQKGLEIDTYEIEPWHWRYVWEVFATYLRDNNMTIAEFYDSKISLND